MIALPPMTNTMVKTLEVACDITRRYGQAAILPTHFLFSTLRICNGIAYSTLRRCCGNVGLLERDVLALLKHGNTYTPEAALSKDLADAIFDARKFMSERTRYRCLSTGYVLWGIANSRNEASDLLVEYGVEEEIILKKFGKDREP